VVVEIEVDPHWAAVELIEPVAGAANDGVTLAATESMEGIVSPSFRKVGRTPFLKLTARASEQPRAFRTVFRIPGGAGGGAEGRAAPAGSKK
jgi:hypothetical protein